MDRRFNSNDVFVKNVCSGGKRFKTEMSKSISFKPVLEIQLRECSEGNFQPVTMVQ